MYPRAIILIAMLAAGTAAAYPEFQTHLQQTAGRNVNCALCHSHPDGPEGLKPGQIGHLKPAELDALNRARAAFEPGQQVDSPILNAFGDRIMQELGKNRFLQLRLDPAALPGALAQDVDLDGDGLSDAREISEGTHPLDPQHGDPWALLWINLKRRWAHVVLIALATGLGLYGLGNLLMGFDIELTRRKAAGGGH